jgi:hypothetical protein
MRPNVDLHRIDVVAIGTLALLTTDPASTFVALLDDFAARREARESVADALDAIWHQLRPHCEEVIGSITNHDVPSIVASYQGRGLYDSHG